MRGDGGVAGEGRVVGIPKFHSWGKCTMPLTNINSDWMSNASSGLCITVDFNCVRTPAALHDFYLFFFFIIPAWGQKK